MDYILNVRTSNPHAKIVVAITTLNLPEEILKDLSTFFFMPSDDDLVYISTN